MKLDLEAAKYVLAVSGGVDSVVLLDLLAKQADLELVVAHFDHGIRADSAKDAKFVENLAKKYNVPFELGRGRLNKNTSEATARVARYKFLDSARKKHKAKSIVTAHHQDDLIETAIINILRGTGWRGLTAMLANNKIKRPFLNYPKKDVLGYARKQNLSWREDQSNQDIKFLRNRVRAEVVPRLSATDRAKILENIYELNERGSDIKTALAKISPAGATLDRRLFASLPSNVADELMLDWLRRRGAQDLDQPTISRLSLAAKAAKPGTKQPVGNSLTMLIESRQVHLL